MLHIVRESVPLTVLSSNSMRYLSDTLTDEIPDLSPMSFSYLKELISIKSSVLFASAILSMVFLYLLIMSFW